MAPHDLERSAKEAFVDDNFELAIDLYTQAITMDPQNPDLFADRAQANIKLENFTEAVADSNKALLLDPSMAKAYLRKGTACFKLEEYQTAKAALEGGAALSPGDARFTNMIKECDEKIAEEVAQLSNQFSQNVPPTNAPAPAVPSSSEVAPVIVQEPVVAPPPPTPKYRHGYYQKPEEVVVTIFAKGVPAQHVTVDFGEQILSVTISIPGQDEFIFQPRLYGKIKPEICRYEVMSTKIEMRLAKAEAINWTSLEFTRENTVQQKLNAPSASQSIPSYPSSKSKLRPVDWDKLEAEVKKEEKEEKLEGDAALNKLFSDIYRDADDDTKRAMRKSFLESNGTVLSTNWKEVGAKKVETSPPTGMELKKWES
ncbi:hypothetical protein MKX01_032675 [Papaver californicum]|nr:hypothetical protein MKX01_032675 [Papaver californicum]